MAGEERRLDGRAFRWPGGKLVAVPVMIGYEAWSDGSSPPVGPFGNQAPPGGSDPVSAAWAEYGPRRGIWRLLDVLGRHQVRSTLATSGLIAERHPDSVRAAAEHGHEISCHSWAQDVIPRDLSETAERENITRTIDALHSAAGTRPRGWISPGGGGSPSTARLVAEAGLSYHLHNFDDDLPYAQCFDGAAVIAIPFSADVNDLVTCLRYGRPPGAVLDAFRDVLAAWTARDEPGVLPVTVHAHLFGHVLGATVLDRILDAAAASPQVWLATQSDVAAYCMRQAGIEPAGTQGSRWRR